MCSKSRLLFVNAVTCFVFISFNASAQDLRDAVMYALENHPAVESAYLGYKAAEHGKAAERSNYYPEVSANFTAGRTFQDNATSRGLSVTRGAAYSGIGEGNIALRQVIFDGLETKNRVNAADARMKSLSYALLDVEGAVTLRVAQSYIEIMRVSSALKILTEQAENTRDYEKRIIELVEEGAADEAELQQARDVAMIIDGIRAEYEGQLVSAQAGYLEASGQEFLMDYDKPDSLQSYIQDDVVSAIGAAKDKHPLLQSARMDSKAARHDMRAEHAQMYPNVSGELSYLKTDKVDVIGGETKDARAVIRMSWGFSTGGREFSEVRKKRYEHYEASANYEALEREIERDVYQAYASYRTLKRKVDLARDRVDLNEKLLAAYKAQFEGVRISLLSLMRAESQLFNALLEESDNTYYLLSSEYIVLSSLGQLKDILKSQDGADIQPSLSGGQEN